MSDFIQHLNQDTGEPHTSTHTLAHTLLHTQTHTHTYTRSLSLPLPILLSPLIIPAQPVHSQSVTLAAFVTRVTLISVCVCV